MQRCDRRLAWLPALLPADARRYRTDDAAIAAALAHAGAELVDEAPDCEIASAAGVRGDAATAFVPLVRSGPVGTLPLRVAGRIAAHASIRVHAAGARRRIGRLYGTAVEATWELGQPVRPRGTRTGSSLGARLPLGRVVANRLPRSAFAAAEAAAGLDGGLPVARHGGTVVALVGEAVLRVAVGPAARRLDLHRDALARLESVPRLRPVLPRALGAGATGIARWFAEERVRGDHPPPLPTGDLMEEVLDFLVDLFHSGDDAPAVSPSALAATVAAVCPAAQGDAVLRVGAALDDQLVDLPRGYAHGDFFAGNLLVRDGRLAGVLDWEAAGAGRLPLLDLLALETAARRRETQTFGAAVAEWLLPWAAAGGDERSRAYCARLGLDHDRPLLERLALAYWLDRTAFEAETFSDVGGEAWARRDVEPVLNAVSAGRLL